MRPRKMASPAYRYALHIALVERFDQPYLLSIFPQKAACNARPLVQQLLTFEAVAFDPASFSCQADWSTNREAVMPSV